MELLGWVPVLPLLGFVVLFLTEGRLPDRIVAFVGAGSVGLAAVFTLLVSLAFMESGQAAYVHTFWTWIAVGDLTVNIRLYFDGLAMVMTGVITGVGFLIHLYATGYMAGETGYSRFFAYMNLFVFAMLMLVLGDNLLVLFLGWEGVGLCSYLLIGFYHEKPENGYAARKAFVVTRVGDTAMALGLFLMFRELGTIEIQSALILATDTWPEGSSINTVIACLLLGGAMGKSAQVPLQTWLPDAMAGPTPVSALIHAATMVTAGVYLIARTHDLFLLSQTAQLMVAVIGLLTLFIAACSAMTQTDLKRILAYSTMSQIGYMFFALGVGAWSAAIFHLMTHAFFKALLFLSAGSVILALHHEQNVYRMGGLRKALPVPFFCMTIGSAALAALPLTSGFYSKDEILLISFDLPQYGPFFWTIAGLAALLTSMYSLRMMMLVFFGEQRNEAHDHSSWNMTLPLVVLAMLALGGGWFGLSAVTGVLPDGGLGNSNHGTWLVWLTAAIPIIGVLLGFVLYRNRQPTEGTEETGLQGFLRRGWDFDRLFDATLVNPFTRFANLVRNEPIDQLYNLIVTIFETLNKSIVRTQTGQLRWYAANMGFGLALVFLLALVLG
ncbi:MAG: NADH-quinone oxidoreductase subunit L [Pseudomonadales bacterium]|nr:NADH-quinone oxidoreductase subunit L [Pseudomonadales bacterium]